MTIVQCPVSVGELLDRVSIARLKAERTTREETRDRATKEFVRLVNVVSDFGLAQYFDDPDYLELYEVNGRLWEIEDDLRLLEADGTAARLSVALELNHPAPVRGASFVSLARLVYELNDRRSALKARLDEKSGSAITELKEYAGAEAGDGDEPCTAAA